MSTAISRLGTTTEKAKSWEVGIQTVLSIINNILKHPGDGKYYRLNTTSSTFHKRFDFS